MHYIIINEDSCHGCEMAPSLLLEESDLSLQVVLLPLGKVLEVVLRHLEHLVEFIVCKVSLLVLCVHVYMCKCLHVSTVSVYVLLILYLSFQMPIK